MDAVLHLQALAAIIGDPPMRDRFMALTGYDIDTLRARAAEPDMGEAVSGFLSAHEPDLLKVAELIGAKPGDLCARY